MFSPLSCWDQMNASGVRIYNPFFMIHCSLWLTCSPIKFVAWDQQNLSLSFSVRWLATWTKCPDVRLKPKTVQQRAKRVGSFFLIKKTTLSELAVWARCFAIFIQPMLPRNTAQIPLPSAYIKFTWPYCALLYRANKQIQQINTTWNPHQAIATGPLLVCLIELAVLGKCSRFYHKKIQSIF